MDFQQLSIFCTLLSEKSMTEAANRLQITQPTVSRQLKLLEAELGVDLLERETREISPTVQGQLFFDYAQKILNLVKQAQMAVQSLPQHLEGRHPCVHDQLFRNVSFGAGHLSVFKTKQSIQNQTLLRPRPQYYRFK